jgi:hypothetical protein
MPKQRERYLHKKLIEKYKNYKISSKATFKA